MNKNKSFNSIVLKPEDLVTSYEETRAGFLSLALERNHRATKYITEAKILRHLAEQAKSAEDLKNIPDIKQALMTAAGVSDKASKYIEQSQIIDKFIEKYIAPAGSSFIDELVYRFLLTRGDTLGGSMRNVAGILAQRKVSQYLTASLKIQNKKFAVKNQLNNDWVSNVNEIDDIDINGISWINGLGKRTLLYNVKVPFIGNNVDYCLLKACFSELTQDLINNPNFYIALGELKGGIDPAGADEHWKTASKALTRIRECFNKSHLKPHIFFIGAAIEKRMSTEIWNELENKTLSMAVNLTKQDQLAHFCNWILKQ